VNEKRKFPRISSLVPEEDAVLISMNNGKHFAAKLVDLSRGGVMMYTDDPSAWIEIGGPYKLYFQSRGEMFHVEGTLVRTDTQFLAFQFFNVTDGYAQFQAVRPPVSPSALLLFLTVDADAGPWHSPEPCRGNLVLAIHADAVGPLIDTMDGFFYSSEKLRVGLL